MDYHTAYSQTAPVVELDCSNLPSMTKQQHFDDCDINKIVARFDATGVLEHIRDVEPQFIDATTMSYHDAHNLVAAANSAFGSLDAQMRYRFNNSPAEFVSFLEDSRNDPEAITLGLKIAPILPPEPPSEDSLPPSVSPIP
jgi:phage internal scaffolding protein